MRTKVPTSIKLWRLCDLHYSSLSACFHSTLTLRAVCALYKWMGQGWTNTANFSVWFSHSVFTLSCGHKATCSHSSLTNDFRFWRCCWGVFLHLEHRQCWCHVIPSSKFQLLGEMRMSYRSIFYIHFSEMTGFATYLCYFQAPVRFQWLLGSFSFLASYLITWGKKKKKLRHFCKAICIC